VEERAASLGGLTQGVNELPAILEAGAEIDEPVSVYYVT
jgi:hypothetical protein